ncbi:MAG: 5-formyltetrahydrofolate cyclo-ligase [Desulfovibrio sp.]|jgi:5-formyltetrahydrofolate cyclo-ligase|nr:5-formyltetrahydrofolate cyclo-ligase [Desulfovibrio sp.]
MATELEGEKAALRARMRALRRSLDENRRLALSSAACARISETPVWRQSACVALYMAARGEIDCAPLLKAALDEGKRVLLPLCRKHGEDWSMRFAPCPDPAKLRIGAFGILEPPVPEKGPEEGPGEGPQEVPDFLLVPGLAFDRCGFRLGQGGGFYDRLLSDPAWGSRFCAGFAYAFQIVERVPRAPWDRPVRALYTENGLFRVED